MSCGRPTTISTPVGRRGGTWKYDRAGWAPGDVVLPWEIDVTAQLKSSRTLELTYQLDEYVNENRGETWAPFHQTASHLVLFRDAPH
jgi:hypothetical protein